LGQRQVAALLKLLKTERTLKGRFLLINVLSNSRPQAKAAFVSGGALAVLEAWLNECKATHPRLLQLVLTALAELPVTLRALQAEGCGIGKVVSGLKKHASEEVRRAAVTVIGQWKQLVDTTVAAAPPAPTVSAVPAEASAVSTAAQPHPPKADVGQLNLSSAPLLPNASSALKPAAKPATSSTSYPKPSAAAPSLLALDDDNMFSGRVAPARSKPPTPRLHSPASPAAAAAASPKPLIPKPVSPKPVSPMPESSPKEPKVSSSSTSPTARSEAPPPPKQHEPTASERDQASVSGAVPTAPAMQGSGETAAGAVAKIEVTAVVTTSERATPPPEPPVPPETLPTPSAVTAQVRTSSQGPEGASSASSVTVSQQPASNAAAALPAADVHPAPHILSEIITGEMLASKGKADEVMDDPFSTHASEMVAAESEPPPFVKVCTRTSGLPSELTEPHTWFFIPHSERRAFCAGNEMQVPRGQVQCRGPWDPCDTVYTRLQPAPQASCAPLRAGGSHNLLSLSSGSCRSLAVRHALHTRKYVSAFNRQPPFTQVLFESTG